MGPGDLRCLVPNTVPLTVFGTNGLKYWVLGPSGEASRTKGPPISIIWGLKHEDPLHKNAESQETLHTDTAVEHPRSIPKDPSM